MLTMFMLIIFLSSHIYGQECIDSIFNVEVRESEYGGVYLLILIKIGINSNLLPNLSQHSQRSFDKYQICIDTKERQY